MHDTASSRRAQREKFFQHEARHGLSLRLRSSDPRSSASVQEYLRIANLRVIDMEPQAEAIANILLLHGITVGHVMFPSANISWPRDRQSIDRAVLIIVNSGEVSISAEAAGIFSRDGVIFVAPGEHPVSLSLIAGRNEIMYLGIPAALIADIPVPPDGVEFGTQLPVDLLRAVFQFFSSIARTLKPQISAASIGFVMSEMVRSIVRVMLETATVEQDLYTRAIGQMAESLDDETLNTAKVAARLGVSVRKLQLEFQRQGTTLQAELRRLRIEAVVRARVENPSQSLRSLAEAYGFRSKSALYRALAEIEP